MDNRAKERKPPDKGRVKMKPPDGLKSMPKELAVGALQDGTQRIASQPRDAGQREERSDYGGERIESAAADGTRLATRSVEAFLKSGAEILSRKREPETPSDEPPETPLSETETASVTEEFPSEERPPRPERAENSSPPQTDASITEKPPAERPLRRRSVRDGESVRAEQPENVWRPACQDAEPGVEKNFEVNAVKKSGDAAEESGRVPRGRSKDAVSAKNADRTVKTLAGNDAAPFPGGRDAREPAVLPPPAGQPVAAEYGRRKLMQERGRELAVKRTDVPVPEEDARPEALSVPENGAKNDAAEPPATLSERDAVPIKSKEAYAQKVSSPEPQNVEQGKRELVKARAERIAERRVENVSAGQRYVAVSTDTSVPTPQNAPMKTDDAKAVRERAAEEIPESRADATVKTKRLPSSIEVSAPAPERLPVKTREAYPVKETPSVESRNKRTLVREKARQVAEGRMLPTSEEREPAVIADTPKQNAAPVKTKEAYAPRETPDAMPRTRTAVKERTAQVAERPASSDSSRPEVSEPRRTPVKMKKEDVQIQEPPPQNFTVRERADAAFLETSRTERMPVRTKETYAHWQTDAPPVADKSANVRQQAAVKTREADIQTSASSVAETPKETEKTVRTRDGLIQNPSTTEEVESGAASGKETALPKERPDYKGNPGQRKPVREQSRAVEHKPNLRKEPPTDNVAKGATGESKPRATSMDEGVKTKGAWLRQQGKDRPRERFTTRIFKGKLRANGQPPVKLSKGLPAPKTANNFPLALPPWEPSKPKGDGMGTPATRFVREKGGAAAGKTVRTTAIKETGTTGVRAVKTAERTSAKAVRTAEMTSVKMAKHAANAARKARARAKAAKDAAVAAKRGVKAAVKTLKAAVHVIVVTVQAAVSALESLIAALAAGSTAAIVIVLVICLIALLIAAPFGLLFSGETVDGENIQSAMSELVGEYGARIERIKEETDYDELDIADDIMSAMMSNRKNVLAVYAVRVTTKDADATEVVTLTDEKKEILRETFFDMNQISNRTTSRTVYSDDEVDDLLRSF